MPTVLDAHHQHRAAESRAQAPIHRQLESLAGFFDDEAEAHLAVWHLQHVRGLGSHQVQLLGPADIARPRFARAAVHWAPRWSVHGEAHGSIAFAVVLLLFGGASVLGAWLLAMSSDELTSGWLLFGEMVIVAVLAAGAAMAAVWQPGLLLPKRRIRRFETGVQQQLAEGHWAVVVHGVPWDQQADVLTEIRSRSQRWCAVAPDVQRL